MKFLHNPHFEKLCDEISNSSCTYQLTLRLESYSCKLTNDDKKAKKIFASRVSLDHAVAFSPPKAFLACGSPTSSFSSIEDDTRIEGYDGRTLFHLVSTLNAAFYPDYDFTNAKSDEFTLETDFNRVKHCINEGLKDSVGCKYSRLSQELWALVDQDINLDKCSIFSYSPDLQSSPFGSDDGSIWSYCYFFYNRQKKKVLLFTGQLESNSFNIEDQDAESSWNEGAIQPLML